MFIINYYQAGGNQRGSSFSSSMGWASFSDKIDFNYIRETLKTIVLQTIEDNCPCMSEMKIYFTIIRIENNEVTGRFVGNVKSLKVLKWKSKRRENNGRTKV